MRAVFARSTLLLILCAPAALAGPKDTVWVEDVHIEEPNHTETQFEYEFQAGEFDDMGAGSDRLTLRLHAGISQILEVAPAVRLLQDGRGPLRLHEVGLEARAILLGEHEQPALVLYGDYYNDTGPERNHELLVGGVAHGAFGRFVISGDLRGTLGLGGELDEAFEIWAGVAAGVALLPERELRLGVEAFAVIPAAGERMFDPAFGEQHESATFYYGPSISFGREPFWTGISAVTGRFVTDAASDVLVRWSMGVDH